MRIERVLLRTLRLRLRSPFRSAGGVTRERPLILVSLEGEGVSGMAECVAMETPHYSSETVDSARRMLERYLVPTVLGRRFEQASELTPVLDRAAKGHPMAKAALEMAAWDAEARGRGLSLAALLSGGDGGIGVAGAVPAGVAVGMQEDEEALLDRIDAYVAQGYRRVKIKIAPGRDRSLLEAVRSRHPRIPLAVDANGSYDVADMERLAELDAFGLLYVEQPFGEDDLVEHAVLQARLATPVCLDEAVSSPGRCRTALAVKACGVVNVKPGRVGGHAPARAIHDLCRDAGVPVWCGGMLESGVGRAHNVALAALPNMRLPGDLSASDRYWERDIITTPFELRSDGMVTVPTGPGVGVELDEDYVATIEVDRTELR